MCHRSAAVTAVDVSDQATAVLRGLRRVGDEAQLTQVLNEIFVSDPVFASDFVALLLEALGATVPSLPSEFERHR
jgi:hypothetical protein